MTTSIKFPSIFVIAGPTASGKSSLALELAKQIDGYIINADSRQIYKELKIGTAIPSPDQIKDDGTWIIEDVDHYLYGYQSIASPTTLYEYQKDVFEILKSNPHRPAILVGGTGLYIDSIIFNYHLSPNKQIRFNREKLNSLNIEQLQELAGNKLKELNESDRQNPRRLIRLIEKDQISHLKGTPLDHKYFVLDIDKDILHDKINSRVDQMIAEGLEEENRNLYEKYPNNPILAQTIGYQEFNEYFKKQTNIENVVDLIKQNTRRYAKRQRTWFTRNSTTLKVSTLKEVLSHI